MSRRTQLGIGLVVSALILFTVPALSPVEPLLTHDTTPVTFDSRTELEERGVEIINYSELSDRGQELYVETLENGGKYSVAPGEGAPEFRYNETRSVLIVIERPDDADLPPADEPAEVAEPRRQQVQRYDLIETTTELPPLGARSQLLRLAGALLAVFSFGVGGYLLFSKG